MSITLQECIVCSFIYYTAAAAAAAAVSPSHLIFFRTHTTLHSTTPPPPPPQNFLPPSSFNRNQPTNQSTNQPNKNKNKNNAHLLDPPHGSKTSSRSNFDCQTRRRSFGREVARTFSWYVYGIHPSIDSFPIVFVSLFSSFIHLIGGKIISVDRRY